MALAVQPALHRFFGRGGLLQKAHAGYEFRAGQIEMAAAVAEALAERHHLLVEAGTGTGKTLAYLLPVLQSGRRVLLSTGTRNLQEQLVRNDVPLLAAALDRELNVISMKGRQNYACKQKIHDFAVQPALLELDDLDYYRRIRTWVETTVTGDQAELDFLPDSALLWQRLNARREACTGSRCPLYNECFLTQLRERASQADLVVVNHHLFFADLVLKRQELQGVLPPYEAVIFDEAHELEEAAAQYFGISVSSHQIEDLARDIGHVLQACTAATPDLNQRGERWRLSAQKLFMQLGPREGRFPLTERESWLNDHAEVYEDFMHALEYLHDGLDAIADKPEAIHTLLHRLGEARNHVAFILESEEEDIVYWIERRGRGVRLQASPIEVSSRVRELLFEHTDTVVLTSATLAVDGSFDYVRGRLGMDHARELIVTSPFHYERQALLYLPKTLPQPNAAGFTAAAADEIVELLTASRGRAFVLCTSYRQMRAFADSLAGRLEYPLLVQGSEPRHLLLERFRATPGAVLLATSSFWQGVDVPGEQLSLVIIDRLPFGVPTDPVVAARTEALRRAGENPFSSYQVPEAVLALKQGFGRLIRSARDRGVLALLDVRVHTKAYGRIFLDSLPSIPRTHELAEVRSFFAAKTTTASAQH